MFVRFQQNIQMPATNHVLYPIFDTKEIEKILSNIGEGTQISQIDGSYTKKIIDFTNETLWIYERLSRYFSVANENVFDYDITGIKEHIEILELNKNDFLGWHHEEAKKDGDPVRKLSAYVLLSDGSDYTGGLVQEFSTTPSGLLFKNIGYGTIFSSYIISRIEKVDSGTLKILRGWATGPNFV